MPFNLSGLCTNCEYIITHLCLIRVLDPLLLLLIQATETELATHIETTGDKLTQLNVDIQASARSAKKVRHYTWLMSLLPLLNLVLCDGVADWRCVDF
jgi:hypothetical protein